MIILNENSLPVLEKTSCTVGTFDGIHKAHQKIIRELKKDRVLKSLIITFEPPPKLYFSNTRCLITDFETKIHILKALNIDYLYVIKFDENFLKIKADEFLKFLVQKLNCKKLVVGYDWRFGYRKEGNIDFLKFKQQYYKYELKVINPIVEENIRISSTKVRELLKEGKVESVKDFLGRVYFLRERVIEGNKLGRKLGFPTLNILPDKRICLKKGVYAGLVEYKKHFYKSAINYGTRPTIDGNKLLLEAHILEEKLNINNEYINIHFLKFIREEKKFNSLTELVNQIKLDIIKAKNILNS